MSIYTVIRSLVGRGKRTLAKDRRASVALYIGLLAPTLLGATTLGVEVSRWSAYQLKVQQIADAAALAGIMYYNQNSGQANLAQNAATYAAHVAQLNGIAGTTTPSWNSGTTTLSDNNVTVRMLLGAGLKNAADNAIEVSVEMPVPLIVASAVSGSSSVTLSASSYAEIASTSSSSGPQPCLMALKTDGITNDITFSGSVEIDASTCSIRSNSGVSFSGSVQANTAGVYAATTITKSGSVQINGGLHPNSGTLADPYISDTTLQNALAATASVTGTAVNITGSNNVTLNPGDYTGLSVQGSTRVTLNPGLYRVNGNVSFAGSTQLTGNGVTIIATGTFDAAGSSQVNLTAPTTSSALNNAIPGVLFASSSTAKSAFTGSSQIPFTGLLYYPNGELDFAGSSQDGSSGCAEVVAGSLKFTGSVAAASNCSQYGTLTFGSQMSTVTSMQLVK